MRVLFSPPAVGPNDNPYVSLLMRAITACGATVEPYDRRRLLSKPDIVHVHWPDQLIRWDRPTGALVEAGKVLFLLAAARRRGTVVVWTAHDLEPHDARLRALRLWFFGRFLRQVDVVLHLSHAGRDAIEQRWPTIRSAYATVIPHGHYKDAYPADDSPSRDTARRSLGIDADSTVLLALGQIREYKNLLSLTRAFATIPGDAVLLIAGRVVDPTVVPSLVEAARSDPRVRLHLQDVPEDDIAAWFAASDVAVLAYDTRSSLNSGAAILALSLLTPAVLSDGPAARELAELAPGWIRLCNGNADDALRVAFDVASSPPLAPCDLSALDWAPIGRATTEAYRAGIARRQAQS